MISMSVYPTVLKSVTTVHVNKIKNRNCIIISIDVEKNCLTKFIPIHDKKTQEMGVRRKLSKVDKRYIRKTCI